MLTTVTYCQKQNFFCMTIHVLKVAFLKFGLKIFLPINNYPAVVVVSWMIY